MRLPHFIRRLYAAGEYDYWMKPLVASHEGRVSGRIQSGDTVLFMCRRGEREVQLTEAFVGKEFDAFQRALKPEEVVFVPLVEYHEKLSGVKPLVSPIRPAKTLGDLLSSKCVRQTLITETEKESHVTFFFNGRRNKLFPGQRKKIIRSWDDFAAHPEMKSREIAEAAIEELERSGFMLVNFPAGDVIGHLESWETKTNCIEAIDEALGRLYSAAVEKGWSLLITADHGLLEKGRTHDGRPSVTHTNSRVPFIVVDPHVGQQDFMVEEPSLAGIAPTVLEFMGLEVPPVMTGRPIVHVRSITERVLVVILDGWGEGKADPQTNPIYAADTPTYDFLRTNYPWILLDASGSAVGLPEGRNGNSETGHIIIGAGRVIEQDETRLQLLMSAGLDNHEFLLELIQRTLEDDRAFHIIGILSEGSSHGNICETAAVSRLAKEKGLTSIFVHLILDGRSAPVRGAADLLERHLDTLSGEVVTLVGRGYALDRGGDFAGKTKLVYEALVRGESRRFDLLSSSP